MKVREKAKIRNRYNQAPRHMGRDKNTRNYQIQESHEVSSASYSDNIWLQNIRKNTHHTFIR